MKYPALVMNSGFTATRNAVTTPAASELTAATKRHAKKTVRVESSAQNTAATQRPARPVPNSDSGSVRNQDVPGGWKTS